MNFKAVANIVITSKALVTRSDALVTSSEPCFDGMPIRSHRVKPDALCHGKCQVSSSLRRMSFSLAGSFGRKFLPHGRSETDCKGRRIDTTHSVQV